MPWDPSKIPQWLRRTPEQQAADDRLQKRLRQTYGPGLRLTATERHLQRAAAIELSAKAHLQHYQQNNSDPKHVRQAAAQLAEARAMQGHYAEASAIHPDKRHAERFAKIAEAIERPDDETCDCQPETVSHPVTGKQVVLPIENVDEIVFDPRHRKLMPLVRCVGCQALNVKPANPQLQKRLDIGGRPRPE